MANLHQPGKKQNSAKRNWKKAFWASSLAKLPVYFVLTVLLVTVVVPAVAGEQVSRWVGEQVSPTFYQSNSQVQQPLAASQLLQQGKSRYEAGQFLQAATLWEQAAQGYSLRREILNQAQSLNYLASAYYQLGEWVQAQKGLVAKINGDLPLLARSRLPALQARPAQSGLRRAPEGRAAGLRAGPAVRQDAGRDHEVLSRERPQLPVSDGTSSHRRPRCFISPA